MAPPVTGPVRKSTETQEDGPPEDCRGPGRVPERDRGHVVDGPGLEREDLSHQNNLDQRNSLECQTRILE